MSFFPKFSKVKPGMGVNFTNSSLKGLTLVEILMTISLLAIAIFPLMTGLGNISETATRQRDQLSAMILGNLIMDSWLSKFQLMDSFVTTEADYDTPKTIIIPNKDGSEMGFPRQDNLRSAEILYNQSFFKIESVFTHLNGTNSSTCFDDLEAKTTPKLSNVDKLIFAIEVKVWKVINPEVSEQIGGQEVQFKSRGAEPGFSKGDEPYYQVCSLYSQLNKFSVSFQ